LLFQHPATWTWTLDDLSLHMVGKPITFEVTASDVGSDDLTFDLDFGDGAAYAETVYSDGAGPDPYPSPAVNPITATAVATPAYAAAWTYTFAVVVAEDDGGSMATAQTFTLGKGGRGAGP